MRILVCGLESSGTRLVHRIVQTGFPSAIHRSWPFGPDYPKLGDGSEPADPALGGIDAIVLVVRTMHALEDSQVRRYHAGSVEQARSNMQLAYVEMFGSVAGWSRVRPDPPPIHVVTYEAVVHDTDAVVAALGRWLGVELTVPDDVYDGNRRDTAGDRIGWDPGPVPAVRPWWRRRPG